MYALARGVVVRFSLPRSAEINVPALFPLRTMLRKIAPTDMSFAATGDLRPTPRSTKNGTMGDMGRNMFLLRTQSTNQE